MTLPQWRTIFLSLFPYSIDYSYADRLFNAISTSSSGDSNGFITYQVLSVSKIMAGGAKIGYVTLNSTLMASE
jgi:hypothetical protein